MNRTTLSEAKELVCEIVALERQVASKRKRLDHFLDHEASRQNIDEVDRTAARFAESSFGGM